jgi:hypothetical protein
VNWQNEWMNFQSSMFRYFWIHLGSLVTLQHLTRLSGDLLSASEAKNGRATRVYLKSFTTQEVWKWIGQTERLCTPSV